MADTQFSILIPVYNGEKTIARAVDSALAQTCGDFELLICDDGSTDGTGAILARYAERDSRIRVLKHERNRGGLCARNTLIRAFSGEYCVWLDADDSYEAEFLETAKNCIDADGWDIFISTYRECNPDGSVKENSARQDFKCRADNMLDVFFYRLLFPWGLCAKAIRREVMKKAIAPDVRIWPDDTLLSLPMFYFAKSCIFCGRVPMYNYNVGTGYWSSAMEDLTREKVSRLCESYRQIAEYNMTFCRCHGIELPLELFLASMNVNFFLWRIIFIEDREDRDFALSEFQKYFKISLTPAPYAPTFHPPGCEPKKFSYTLNQTSLKL